MTELIAELAALRARVEALEAERGTVRAPFFVVDAAGRPLLMVTPPDAEISQTSLVLFGPQGHPAVSLSAREEGGFIHSHASTGQPVMGLGPEEGNQGAITIYNGQGSFAAWLGAKPDGSGELALHAPSSKQLALRLFTDSETGIGGIECRTSTGGVCRIPE